MAKQKSKLNDYGSTGGSRLEDDITIANEQARRERQQEIMDEKIDEMAKKTLEFYHTYGKDDYRYQMMVTFLDVAFQMKEAISILTSVRVATSYLSAAIQFIDDTVNFDEEFDKQMLDKSYGPFANLRRRIRTRRAMRNNRRRMSIVIRNITDRLETAHLITDSLRDGFEKMRLTMLKSDEKRRKKEAKRIAKSGQTPTPPQPTAAEKYIMQLAEERGITAPDKKSDEGQGGAPEQGQGGTPDRGIDDILG